MLGAPKQEVFISNIIKFIDKGILIGSGASLNFFLDRIKNSQFSIFGLRFIWLGRLFIEPNKQSRRIFKFLKVLPFIIKDA